MLLCNHVSVFTLYQCTQIDPALLLGNMNDPFWDLPEAIAGTSLSCSPKTVLNLMDFATDQRPHAYALLRTLLRTETWSADKGVSDVCRLVARCGEQPSLLHAMLLVQQLFRYVSPFAPTLLNPQLLTLFVNSEWCRPASCRACRRPQDTCCSRT